MHQSLIKKGLRSKVALILEAGDVMSVHGACTSLGFGCDAIFPYVMYRCIRDFMPSYKPNPNNPKLEYEIMIENYRNAIGKGILKVMSKMGISTLRAYKGAQNFEAIGIHSKVMDLCFTHTPSRIGGATFEYFANDVLNMHDSCFDYKKIKSVFGNDLLMNGNPYFLVFLCFFCVWLCCENMFVFCFFQSVIFFFLCLEKNLICFYGI